MSPNARLFTLFAGWILMFYGVSRRSWPGTIIAITGLTLVDGAVAVGERL